MLALLAFWLPAGLVGQSGTLYGRVDAVGRGDTIPLPSRWVLLHEVSMAGGRSIDSSLTDAGGEYHIRISAPDTSAIYVASVAYNGITYFSPPADGTLGIDTLETLLVYDTSSVSPPVSLAERHVVVRNAGPDGGRAVLELIVVANDGDLTRIAGDPASPVWQMLLPANASNVEVGESDVSAEAVVRRGDTIALIAPVPPGQKQVVLTYVIPGDAPTLELPMGQSAERVQVLLQDTSATILGASLSRVGVERVENLIFARFEGTTVAAGTDLVFRFSRPRSSVADRWWLVVVASIVAFALALWRWQRSAALPVAPNPDVLASRIAGLDDWFVGLGPSPTKHQRHQYEVQRSQLKAELAGALAQRHRKR